MARTVKKKEHSPEEKLAAALVPEEEQPYKVPGNWCWVRLLDTFYNLTDSKRKIQQKNYLRSGSIAVVDQGQEIVGGYTDDEDMLFMGELPVIVFGDHTRCIKYVDFPFAQGADGVKVLAPKKCYEPRAFYYALQNVNIPNMGYRRHYPLFKEYFIPLPPLPEQQRIVTLIESLFADLDEAKEKLTSVVEGFALRKAAILHQAFTGELTAKWREENGIEKDSWKETSSSEIFEYITSGSRGWAQYYSDRGAIFLRMGNLDHGTIELDTNDIQYVELPDKAEGQRSRVRKGDILISITADIGMIACIKEDINEAYINQHIALARPKSGSYSEFIAWYLVSDVGLKQLQHLQRGATKVGLTLKDIKSLELKMPCLDEQLEIVRILDDLFEQEQQAQSAVETVLADIDTLKKSILARAFRGELNTGDPEEERAEELLKRVL